MNMSNALNANTENHVFYPTRDKYGRSCHDLHSYPQNRKLGVIVRLPKAWIEERPNEKYLVNDWTKGHQADKSNITYHRTLALAKAHLLSVATFPVA